MQGGMQSGPNLRTQMKKNAENVIQNARLRKNCWFVLKVIVTMTADCNVQQKHMMSRNMAYFPWNLEQMTSLMDIEVLFCHMSRG